MPGRESPRTFQRKPRTACIRIPDQQAEYNGRYTVPVVSFVVAADPEDDHAGCHPQDAHIFFHKKEVQAPEIGEWKDTTRAKLARLYINYMTEAGMLSQEKRVHTITPPIPDIALERYLKANGETSVLKAITGAN